MGEAIGRGGFGVVYRAEYQAPGGFRRMVALKVLNDSVAGQEELAQRLRDEARMLGMLNHPSIVKVDELLELDGRWAIAMEYVEGVTLRTLTKALKEIPARVAVRVCEQVAGALEAVYGGTGPDGRPLEMLHRDIKPSNIQITVDGEVKVLDFGVARAEFDAREAETRSLRFGSTGYLSPERLLGSDSHEGDIFALGVVLWETLCGQRVRRVDPRPRGWGTRRDTLLETLVDLHPDLPEVHILVADMLSYQPDHRPDATAVRRRLRAILRSVDGPELAEWAGPRVTEIRRRQPRKVEELTGLMLAEGDATEHTLTRIRKLPSEVETERIAIQRPPSRARRGIWLGLGALVLVLGGLALLAAWAAVSLGLFA